MSADRIRVLEPGEVRPSRVPLPPVFALKATRQDTDGRFTLMEMTVVHDIPPHTHLDADENIYVLDGSIEVTLADRRYTAGKGAFMLLPREVPHAIRRLSDAPPVVLQISSPGGWEDLVADLVEAGPAVMTAGRLDPAKINPISVKHGIVYEV